MENENDNEKAKKEANASNYSIIIEFGSKVLHFQ